MSSDYQSSDSQGVILSDQDCYSGQEYQCYLDDSYQLDQDHYQYKLPQEKIYPSQKYVQQQKSKTNLSLLLEEQITSNSDINHELCREVGQKFLQILFIKIVNVIIQGEKKLQQMSMKKLQQMVVHNFLNQNQDIQNCLQQHKLFKQIGKLFLTSNYKQIQHIEKQLISLIQLNKTFFQERQNKKLNLFINSKNQDKQSTIKHSEQSICLPISIQTDETLQEQQNYFQSLINISQIAQKPELVIIDKVTLPSQPQIIKQVKNKFTDFLNHPTSKNDKKKACFQNYHSKNPLRFKNFKKDKQKNLYSRNNRKYVQKELYDQSKKNEPMLHTYGLNCYYKQSPYYNYQKYYQHTNPYQYSSNFMKDNGPQSKKFCQPYKNTQYTNPNQNITMTMIDQPSKSFAKQDYTLLKQQSHYQKYNQDKIYTSNDSKDLLQLVKQIGNSNNVEKSTQNSQNVVQFFKQLDKIYDKKQLKSVQTQSNCPISQWNNVNDLVSSEHKKKVQQYLLSIMNYRNQINIFCQYYGLNPQFQRKTTQKKKFIVQSTLQFQSLYLNKKKVKILTEGIGKNTKEATQAACKKMLRILYQNIQEMWKDFVKLKQKKGIKS